MSDTRRFTAGTHNLSPSDFILEIDSTGGQVTLVLPSITAYKNARSRSGAINQLINYRWQDISGTAGTNNIIFQANALDQVNGASSITVDTDDAGGTLVITSDNAWALDGASTGGGGGIPYGNDIGAADAYEAVLTQTPTLDAGFTFEVRIATGNTNTGASTMDIGLGVKAIVDSDGNPLTAGMLDADSIYLFTYDADDDEYQLLGLAKPDNAVIQEGVGTGSSYRINNDNTAVGACSTISGGSCNSACYAGDTVGGGRSNTASGYYSMVGGGRNNLASGYMAVVNGGCANTSSGYGSVVGGGYQNASSNCFSTIGGGNNNIAGGERATVGGGEYNTASCFHSFVGGGRYNVAGVGTIPSFAVVPNLNNFAVVGGGAGNLACKNFATIAGGYCNLASANYAMVGSGKQNSASGDFATIGGGGYNTSSALFATVGGGCANSATGLCSTIGGGLYNSSSCLSSTVGGGRTNTASGEYATIGGGLSNSASNYFTTVGGGDSNTASGEYATVSGGQGNTASASCSSIVGGYFNVASATKTFVGGGRCNVADGDCSAILGGNANSASGYSDAMIVGSNITANRACATFVNKLSAIDLDTCSALPAQFGFYYDTSTCVVMYVP